MCVYTYVYVCVYVHVHVCECTYMCTCVYIHMCKGSIPLHTKCMPHFVNPGGTVSGPLGSMKAILLFTCPMDVTSLLPHMEEGDCALRN